MKITVTEDGRRIVIPLPMGPITSGIICLVIKRHAEDLPFSADALREIFSTLRKFKRKHGGWRLIEVHGADGETVTIDF